MTPRAATRVLGLPTDRLVAVYLLAAGAALLFPNRPPGWLLLLTVHVIIAAIAWPLLRHPAPDFSQSTARRIRTFADWLPLLAVPALYTELAVLNRAVHGGTYFDDVIIAAENIIFGGQPSREWAAAAPQLWLSELLHGAYLSYYFIIFVPPLLLFANGRIADFRAALLALMLSFFLHYLFFIYFPVQGPRYLFPAPTGSLENGAMYQLAHRILESGSAQGAAFPSSHVGVSVTQTLITLRYMPRLAPLVGLLTIGLAAGAVYGGFHYATDAAAGALLGTLAWLLAPRVTHVLQQRAPVEPAHSSPDRT